MPRAELAEASELAAAHRHPARRRSRRDEFDDPDYLKNDGTRCYYCKSELYSTVERLLARTRRAR